MMITEDDYFDRPKKPEVLTLAQILAQPITFFRREQKEAKPPTKTERKHKKARRIKNRIARQSRARNR